MQPFEHVGLFLLCVWVCVYRESDMSHIVEWIKIAERQLAWSLNYQYANLFSLCTMQFWHFHARKYDSFTAEKMKLRVLPIIHIYIVAKLTSNLTLDSFLSAELPFSTLSTWIMFFFFSEFKTIMLFCLTATHGTSHLLSPLNSAHQAVNHHCLESHVPGWLVKKRAKNGQLLQKKQAACDVCWLDRMRNGPCWT